MTINPASEILGSWRFDFGVIAPLGATALIYLRGWLRSSRSSENAAHFVSFFAGLALVFFALQSPLDSLDSLSLTAHMAQHMLLMMFAPALLLAGRPIPPLLKGLPSSWVREGLAPFLTWPLLQRLLAFLTHPVTAWMLFAISTIAWHVPALYEKALASPDWHVLQHALFFWTGVLFWWPVLEPAGRSPWPRWTKLPYLLLADIVNTALSAALVFSGKVLYPHYAILNPKALTDQAAAGALMWVPGSIVYLAPAVVIATRLMSPALRSRPNFIHISSTAKPKRIVPTRRAAQIAMLLLAAAIVWDGLRGPTMAPMNLAGTLPWTIWRPLAVLTLLLGNLVCFSCPLTLARDFFRTLVPARLPWPRALRNKWLPVALLVLFLWSYETFALWNSPQLTALLIVTFFTAVILVDGIFRGASFCKYVCPIGQFQFIGSLFSASEVRVKSLDVCRSCTTYDCLRGSPSARGCELHLFQPRKSGSMDCTFCMDCVSACPHHNVAVLDRDPTRSVANDLRRSSIGRFSNRPDIAAFAVVFTFGALVNAAGMIGGNANPALLVGVGAIAMPAIAIALCRVVNGFAAEAQPWPSFALGLVPLGFAMWVAHLTFHLTTGWTTAAYAVARFTSGHFAMSAAASAPAWLHPLQITSLDIGLIASIYILWRISRSRAFVAAPWIALSSALYAAGVWILFQPMQMRGVMMMH